jgi:hypothetical protein
MAWSPRDSILPPEWFRAGSLLETGRALRERMKRMVPTLFWQGDGGQEFAAVAHAEGGLPSALDAALTGLRAEHGPPAWFGVLLDAYGRISTVRSEEHIQPEELADRFAAGDGAVVEQLILLIGTESRVTAWRQVYRWTPGDGWEWEGPQYMLEPVLGGGLMEVVQKHAA